jgi:YVTN family beta-propeller protein
MKNLLKMDGRGLVASLLVLVLGALFGAGAAHAQLNAYTANVLDNTLSVIDVATNTVVGAIPVAGQPIYLVINRAGNRAYVTLAMTRAVAVVDLVAGTVIATTPPIGVGSAHSTLGGPGGEFLYAIDMSGNVVRVIDTATNTLVTSLPVGGGPIAIGDTPDGTQVYVSDNFGNFSVIDTATNAIVSTFSVPGNPNDLAFTPDGAFLYIADNSNPRCTVVDTATQAVVAVIPTASGSGGIAITPDGSTVYQLNSDADSVAVIDTATNTVVANVPVGTAPIGIAVTPDGSLVYVSNLISNSVSVIDTATNAVVATVPVGRFPFHIAIPGPTALTSDTASVTVNEGQTAANTGTVHPTTATLTASVGTVVNNGDGTWSWSFATSDGPNQNQTVLITGDGGLFGASTTFFNLAVHNVAPTVTRVSNNGPVAAGGSATITVSATDPAGAGDPLAYAFDCDNNGSFEIGPQAGNSAVCGFGTAGSKTVTVRVTDGDGGVATGSTVVTVVTPQDQIAELIAQVRALVAAGNLTASNAKPLINALENAANHLDKGQISQTCKKLEDFVKKVAGGITTGKIVAADGQALIDAAEAIQDNLGC